jgi:hypothetical protein
MVTKLESIARLQRRLDDAAEEVWTSEQLGSFLQDGYDRLCRASECLFDMEMYDTQPLSANHTKEYENEFIDTFVLPRFMITRESDAEFVDGSPVVSNHTRPSDAQFMSPTDPDYPMTPTTRTLFRLPDGVVSVDRVTHDWLRLDPEHDRYHRKTRSSYQTLEGGVFAYQMDQDGWQSIRLVNVPVTVVSTEEITGTYGAIRRITSYNLEDEPVIGSYGALRVVPRHFCGDQYGVVRRIVPDDDATRVELYRLGKDLDHHPFEIPDRAVKYVEWWAMHRAYSTPGEGENKKLADHFLARFEQGLQTMKMRIRTTMRERTIAMGSKRETGRDGYLEHFPANYGYGRPFRRGSRG